MGADNSKELVDAGQENISPDMAAANAIPVRKAATWEQVKALFRYMTKTEVHTYAFSVAAQVILSLFPFILLLLTLTDNVFHSKNMTDVVAELISNFLPNHQDFIMHHMRLLVVGNEKIKLFSVVMLFITVTGVFLPLEVALNSVWGVKKNRSYLHNQVVSIALAIGVAALAMLSVAVSAAQRTVLSWLFFGHIDNVVYKFVGSFFLQMIGLVASVGLFFLIYWGLPNRKVPMRSVLPTAVVMGVLWTIAKWIYILVLPRLDFHSVYGPFDVSVTLMTWAFVSGLLLLAGAYVSATRQALREAHEADVRNR
jgi:YihY family inner membrane protein